jgi:hypothetical protein
MAPKCGYYDVLALMETEKEEFVSGGYGFPKSVLSLPRTPDVGVPIRLAAILQVYAFVRRFYGWI